MHQTNRGQPTRRAFGLAALLLASVVTGAPAQEPAPVPGPAPGAATDRTGAVIVPINGSVTLRMSTKALIRSALNEKELVARVDKLPLDPTGILITGLQAGTTRITLTDVNNKTEVYEVVVQIDVDLLRSLLRRTVPTANITVTPSANNVLILSGNVAHTEDVDVILRVAQSIVGGAAGNIINAMTTGGVMQVQLDVVIAQVNRTQARSQGFNFLLGNKNIVLGSQINNLTTISGVSVAGSGAGTVVGGQGGSGMVQGTLLGPGLATAVPQSTANFVFGLVPAQFLGILQALRQERLAKLLAEPKLITLSGRPATFLSGGQQAVPEITGGGTSGGVVGTRFEPFGTRLTFLPIVLGNGKIYLEVQPSISELNAANGFTIAGLAVPGRIEQTVQTAVLLQDGQTFAIGGLIQSIIGGTTNKVPILGDLPFVGSAFNTVTHTEDEQELVILVTPHLIDPMDCRQYPKKLPGQETRSPDDFELFMEYILEAPRGQRRVFDDTGHYVPAYKNDPSAAVFPCARDGKPGKGSVAGNGGPAGPGPCADGKCVAPGGVPVEAAGPPAALPAMPGPTPAGEPTLVPTGGPVPPAPPSAGGR